MELLRAFRTLKLKGSEVKSSAEWCEEMALELGDRVAEDEFGQAMYEAWVLTPWVGN